MHWYKDIPWWGILTTKRNICQYIDMIDSDTSYELVFCMVKPKDHPRYLPTLICLCMKMQVLNFMRFRTRDGIRKLTAERYNREIFDGCLETKQEMENVIWTMEPALAEDAEAIELLWEKLKKIRILWCNMIASPTDRPWISELVYAFEYVMSHKRVPMPKYSGEEMIIPKNYRNYHLPIYEDWYPYRENGGPDSDSRVCWSDRYHQPRKAEESEESEHD